MNEQVGRLRWPRGGPPLFDVLLALGLAALSLQRVATTLGPTGAPAYVLALLHTLPLAVRRRFPYGVLAISVASGLAVAVLGLSPVFLGPAILVPVYTVAAYCDRRSSLAGLAAVEAAAAAVLLTPGGTGAATWLGDALVLGAAWLLGHFVHDRRVYAAQLEQRTAELEAARGELARRAVAEERLRIARELHDVVAHSMSVIAVQSGVGAHVAVTQPEEARKALAAIEVTSRTTLNELRRLLGVLREDGQPQGSLAPVPRLAGLDALLAEMREAGLAVKLRVEGTPVQVPAGIDLSAYRIVQERLTNVLKHAGAARAQVLLGYGDKEITIEVTDEGRGVAPGGIAERLGTGHGLIGLRERVTAEPGWVFSPGGWTPPPGVLPAWSWVPPEGARPRPDVMPWWVRVWYALPLLDRYAHAWMWARGGWEVCPPPGAPPGGQGGVREPRDPVVPGLQSGAARAIPEAGRQPH